MSRFINCLGEVRESLFLEDSRLNREQYEHCWEFKECETLEEYINTYLNSGSTDKDIDESSYQFTYDTSNDWFRDEPTWTDVQNGFIVGALWMKKLMENAR